MNLDEICWYMNKVGEGPTNAINSIIAKLRREKGRITDKDILEEIAKQYPDGLGGIPDGKLKKVAQPRWSPENGDPTEFYNEHYPLLPTTILNYVDPDLKKALDSAGYKFVPARELRKESLIPTYLRGRGRIYLVHLYPELLNPQADKEQLLTLEAQIKLLTRNPFLYYALHKDGLINSRTHKR